MGILLCAVAAPITLQRASVWSTRADGADQARLQSEALHVEHFLRALGTTNQDARMFGTFAEYANDAGALNAQAAAIDHTHPRLALRIDRQAQAERSVAAGVRQALQSNVYTLERSPPSFRFAAVLRSLYQGNLEAAGVESSNDRGRARVAHSKTTNYDGIAMLWTMGLFFFTLAQVARRRSNAQQTFALAGTVVVITTVVLTLVVWA